MARLALAAAVGVAVSFIPGGGAYAFQAAAFTYGATGFLDPKTKVQGSRLSDLKAPAASYGSPWAYVEGAPRLAGVFLYSSAKREIATTESVGKGGPGVESTTYTYELDCLIGLAINPCERIRRIFSNGKLIWTNADDSSIDSLTASATTPLWRDIRFYSGALDQLPDPVYEAAVGIGNAPAYRGRATVFIEGLNLGNGGQLPVLTFEVCSEAELGSINDLVGYVPTVSSYNVSALFPNPDGSVTVHAVTHDSGDPVLTVTVFRLQTDGTLNTLQTYFIEGSGFGTGTSSGFGNVDRSVGVFSHNNNGAATANMRLYGDDGGLQCDALITGGNYGTAGPRYVLCGDDLVVGGFTGASNSYEIFRISVSAGSVVASSLYSVHGLSVDSMAIIGNDLWAKAHTGPTLLRFDLDTMALDPTVYSVPSGTSDANGNRLYASGGRLHYALRGVTSGVLYGFNSDGSWEILNTNLGLAAPAFGQECLLGETYYNLRIVGHGVGNPAPLYRSSPAIGASQVPLDEVVSRLCFRTGLLEASDIDVTALAGKYVRALAVTQIGPARSTLELLMGAHLFDFVEGEKLKAVLRGGAPVMTIPYSDLGASADGNAEPLPKKRLNDIELAARVTVKYANVLNDFQDGAESGERLTDSTAETVVEMALGMKPSEAKRVADVQTMDLAVSQLQIGPVSLPRKYAALEPTDVALFVDADGSTFRARVLKATIGGGVSTLDLVLDDATIINSAAETDEAYTGSTLVRLLPDTGLELLDIPILRDADNTPGFYGGTPVRGSWPGAEIDRSSDDVSYARIAASTKRLVSGKAGTALPNFTGGIVIDERSRLTVEVGEGMLTSITNDVLLDSISNALLVGSEIVQFRSAALVSPGVYLLTGFLRGLRGTEWAMASHAADERVVLLDPNTLIRIEEQQAEIGLSRFYKAVTFGKSIASARSQQFTDTGVALKPFAPVDLHLDATGKVVWNRRSRLSSRFLAAEVDVPMGETVEAYSVELRDNTNALVSTTVVTSPSFTLPGSHAGYSVTVKQKSAQVGDGYPSKPLSV